MSHIMIYEISGGVGSGQLADNDFVGSLNSRTYYIWGDSRIQLFGTAVGGNDTITITGAGNFSVLYGDAYYLYAQGGDDTITGGDNGSNYMYGDAYYLYASGVGGNDTIIGGVDSGNRLVGDAYLMSSGAIAGNDTLIAGVGGQSRLIGDAWLGRGGTAGDDVLVSGSGIDYMHGDFVDNRGAATGNDTFVIIDNSGEDFIYDFERGKDTIDLSELELLDLPIPAKAFDRLPAQAREQLMEQFSGFGLLDTNGNGELDAGDDHVEITSGNTIIDLGAAQGNAAGVDVLTVFLVIGLKEDDFTF